jgi:hypothetical protein
MCYMYGLGSGAIINISKGIRLLMNVVFGNDEQRRRIESIPLDEYRRDRSLHYHINESIIPFDAVAHLALLFLAKLRSNSFVRGLALSDRQGTFPSEGLSIDVLESGWMDG